MDMHQKELILILNKKAESIYACNAFQGYITQMDGRGCWWFGWVALMISFSFSLLFLYLVMTLQHTTKIHCAYTEMVNKPSIE